MKNTYLLSTFFALSFAACKKDYKCNCYNPMLTTNQPAATYNIDNMTRSQAKKECDKNEVHGSGATLDCRLQ